MSAGKVTLAHLMGKMEEHRDETNRRLDVIESKVDHLQGFKSKIIGVCVFVGFIVSVVEVYVLSRGGP